MRVFINTGDVDELNDLKMRVFNCQKIGTEGKKVEIGDANSKLKQTIIKLKVWSNIAFISKRLILHFATEEFLSTWFDGQ